MADLARKLQTLRALREAIDYIEDHEDNTAAIESRLSDIKDGLESAQSDISDAMTLIENLINELE